MVWDEPGYLGHVYLESRHAMPKSLHVLRCTDGNIRYYEASGQRISIGTTDRNLSTVTIEDDAPDRVESLRAALAEDRWKLITVRG